MAHALITGGNRGLGFATAERLLRLGYTVTITSRDAALGQQAKDALVAATGGGIDVLPLDLSSRTSIEDLAQAMLTRARAGQPLDLLLQNGGLLGGDGAVVMQNSLVRSGCERTLATNALGPLLLARELLPALRGAARPRIVCVGSRTHLQVKRGAVSVDALDSTDASGSARYARSKLVLLQLMRAFARRVVPIPVHVVCPGLVPETAAPRTRGFTRFLMQRVLPLFPFSNSAADASAAMVWACTDPALATQTGLFLGDLKVLAASADADDNALQEQVWARACALLELAPALA